AREIVSKPPSSITVFGNGQFHPRAPYAVLDRGGLAVVENLETFTPALTWAVWGPDTSALGTSDAAIVRGHAPIVASDGFTIDPTADVSDEDAVLAVVDALALGVE